MSALPPEELKALRKRAMEVAAHRVTYEANGKRGMTHYLPAGVTEFTALTEEQCYEIIGEHELAIEQQQNAHAKPSGLAGLGAIPKAQHATTDLMNANRLARTFGKKLMAVAGQFYAWTGTHWARDTEGEAARCAARLSQIVGKEAKQARDKEQAAHEAWQNAITPEHRKLAEEWPRKHALDKMPEYKHFEELDKAASALEAWSKEAEMKYRQDAALALLRNMLTLDAARLDSDPWLLNCLSGTVDLRTGEQRAHDPADLITKIAPVRFNPDAIAPIFERFLYEIVNEDELVVRFLQKWFGYCCTGDVREQKMLIHIGPGANGKGTLLNALQTVLGDYAGTAPPGLLADGGHGSERHPTEIASLQGKRLITAHEPDDAAVLREGFVKQATGSDRFSARRMRQDFFEFDPTHKLQLLTNYRPVVKSQDHGIWRRLLLVVYPHKFGDPEEIAAGKAHRLKDTALPEKLRQEHEGIFAWLVRGAVEWSQKGLRPPEAVLMASREYQHEQDRIGQFIAERCVLDARAFAPYGGPTGLFTAYRGWCTENNFSALSSTRFLQEMASAVPGWRKAEPKQKAESGERRTVRGAFGVRIVSERLLGERDVVPAPDTAVSPPAKPTTPVSVAAPTPIWEDETAPVKINGNGALPEDPAVEFERRVELFKGLKVGETNVGQITAECLATAFPSLEAIGSATIEELIAAKSKGKPLNADIAAQLRDCAMRALGGAA